MVLPDLGHITLQPFNSHLMQKDTQNPAIFYFVFAALQPDESIGPIETTPSGGVLVQLDTNKGQNISTLFECGCGMVVGYDI
jgi:hypothetical protein